MERCALCALRALTACRLCADHQKLFEASAEFRRAEFYKNSPAQAEAAFMDFVNRTFKEAAARAEATARAVAAEAAAAK